MPLSGFITGLASEADCLAPYFDLTRIRIAAMRPDAAERSARELVAAGCELLVSFGLMCIPGLGWIALLLLQVATLILWILCMVKAYQGQWYRLPVVGALADEGRTGYDEGWDFVLGRYVAAAVA